jgi:hypothetical protein
MPYPDTRPISFTYPPVASMCVVTIHSVFLYCDPPLPCHPPSWWLRLLWRQTFSRIIAQHLSTYVVVHSTHTYLPMKMEQRVPKRRHIKFRRQEGSIQYDVDFYLVHDRDSWWTFVNTVKIIRVSYKAKHF